MRESDYRALIEYRLEEAIESLEDAELLLKSERYRSTINRLYYAAFYAVSAALLTRRLQYSKHSAVSFFDKEFIKTGLFPKDYSRSLHRAFNERQQDDYMPFVEFNPDDIKKLGKDVRELVIGISGYIKNSK